MLSYIHQLSATANRCQQMPLEGSDPLSMIIHSMTSGRWDATSRIVAGLSVIYTLLNLQCFSNSQFPVSFQLTVSSNDADNGHSGSVAVQQSCTGM